MTIAIQPPSIADRLLSLLGKRRAVLIPSDFTKMSGYAMARRESIFEALLRPRGKVPPPDRAYLDSPLT